MTRLPIDIDGLIEAGRAAFEGGRFSEAERLSREVLVASPDHAYASLMLALSLASLGRHREAAPLLQDLARREPSNPVYWSNLGTVLRSCGEFDEALAAYQRAAALGESSAHFLFNLGLLHLDRLEFRKARAALDQAAARAPADAEIRYFQAASSFHEVEHEAAEAALAGWRDLPGLDADLLTRVGSLLTQLGDVAQAEQAFRDALRLNPAHAAAQIGLAQLLERNNRVQEARAQLRSIDRSGVPAGEAAEDLLAIEARLAERAGELEEAKRTYAELLRTSPPLQQYHVLFPLARVHDTLGEYDEAMRVAAQAHESQAAFLSRAAARLLEPGQQVFGICDFSADPADVERWDHEGAPEAAASPVFVVAFPRSGTTLLEQMLDAHPRLRSMDEQPFLQRALDHMRALGATYPERLGGLTRAQLEETRSLYWRLVRTKVRLEPGQQLVDKNPLNLLRLPAIRRLFPHARILLALRHPCDVLVSNYLQHYRAPEIAIMCRTLESLAQGFDRAFGFWDRQHALLGGDVHTVRYEDFVADFATHAREIAAFLQLEWDDAMLEPSRHAAARGFISTPSYSQVVQPVTTRAIGRWRNYAPHLRGAIAILQPALRRWGYEASTNSE